MFVSFTADNVTFNSPCNSQTNAADIEQGTDLLNSTEDPSLSVAVAKDSDSAQDFTKKKVSRFTNLYTDGASVCNNQNLELSSDLLKHTPVEVKTNLTDNEEEYIRLSQPYLENNGCSERMKRKSEEIAEAVIKDTPNLLLTTRTNALLRTTSFNLIRSKRL